MERLLTDIKVSLPEVMAGGACALFITGSPVAGSVFLSLAVIMGIMRYGVELQEIKARQEKFERVFQAFSTVGSYLEELFRNIVFVTSQHQHHDDDDDDTSNYN